MDRHKARRVTNMLLCGRGAGWASTNKKPKETQQDAIGGKQRFFISVKREEMEKAQFFEALKQDNMKKS